MGLQAFDGFEGGTINPAWGGALGGSAPGRPSNANDSGRQFSGLAQFTLPAPANVVTVGMAYYLQNASSYTNPKMMTLRAVNGTDHVVLKMNSTTQCLELRLSSETGTILKTGTIPIPITTWTQIQMKGNIHLTAGTIEVRVNEKVDFVYNGQTGTATATVGSIGFWWASYNTYLDDFWVCDEVDATATQGRPNNTFLGDLRVINLAPTSAGAVTQWTPNTAVPNYTTVDEYVPNTSDYVSAVGASALQDLYNVADLPSTVTTVFGVQPFLYAAKSDAGSAFVKPLLRLSDGTLSTMATQVLSTTYTKLSPPISFLKPSGTVWTPADINGLQAGIEAA